MAYVKNLQTSFFYFFIFDKVRPLRTKVQTHTNRHTHTHTYIETRKSIAIGEILQICLIKYRNLDFTKVFPPLMSTCRGCISIHSHLLQADFFQLLLPLSNLRSVIVAVHLEKKRRLSGSRSPDGCRSMNAD